MKTKTTALVILAALVVFTLAMYSSSLQAHDSTQVSGQFASSYDQRPNSNGEPFEIDIVDLNTGFTITNGTTLSSYRTGQYFYMFVPQVTFDGGKQKVYTAWAKVNGEDLDNSNIMFAPQAGKYTTIVQPTQGIICLQRGDTLEFWHSASQRGIYADAIDVPGQPLVPSAILSVFLIGGC